MLKGYYWIGTVSTIVIGRRRRRESISLSNTLYIQFIHEQIMFHQPDKYDYKGKETYEMVKINQTK